VLGALEPQALQASFLSWVSSISQKLGFDVIHIDGNRRWVPLDREEKLKALHSVSAWSSTKCGVSTTLGGGQIE
jgi:hypothetical protein